MSYAEERPRCPIKFVMSQSRLCVFVFSRPFFSVKSGSKRLLHENGLNY